MSDRTVAWNSPLQRVAAWVRILQGRPRNLTRAQLAVVLPPRGPRGSTQNKCRGARIRMLNNRGFTLAGGRVR